MEQETLHIKTNDYLTSIEIQASSKVNDSRRAQNKFFCVTKQIHQLVLHSHGEQFSCIKTCGAPSKTSQISTIKKLSSVATTYITSLPHWRKLERVEKTKVTISQGEKNDKIQIKEEHQVNGPVQVDIRWNSKVLSGSNNCIYSHLSTK